MFRNLASQLGNTTDGAKKTMSLTLRGDVYTAVDQAKAWIISGAAGDGVSYGSVLQTIQKHFPNTKMRIDEMGKTESEVSVVVGGVTNMILEMSKWEGEGMAGGMAMRRWADTLISAHGAHAGGKKKDDVARGIARGVNRNADLSLITNSNAFTAKIQVMACLKDLMSKIFGPGTAEARQAEATLSSKFL